MQDEELFTPSVQQSRAHRERPYHSSSMFLPSFFGGPLALQYLALVSADRLDLPRERRRLIVGVSTGLLVLALVVAGVLHSRGVETQLRLTLTAAGVLSYVVASRLLKAPERQHALSGGDFEPLGFVRGFGVCLAWGLAQAVLLLVVVAVTG